MKFFGKQFGKQPEEKAQAQSAPPAVSIDPAQNKDLIRVFDGYGRELFITRQQWRDSVLLGSLKKAWNNPDELYNLIVSALNDGFRTDVIEAANHLYKADSDHVRAANIWGIVLIEENRLDDAERVFRDHIASHGENGVIMANLAKIYAKRKEDSKVEEILWHALEIDPNQENGVGWYEVIHRERGGQDASVAALKRIAALPGSWRAQLWLARAALNSNRLEEAIGGYQQALERAERPVPSDLLVQMSGDLGRHGDLAKLLEMTEPHFDVSFHGLLVGNNLIKAHLDLGHIDAARALTDQLYACKRMDWQQALSFWDTEIAKARIKTRPVEHAEALKIAMLGTDNPIWLPASSPASELFPTKALDEISVGFLGSSVEKANGPEANQRELADASGRVSRGLPLFFAEQVYFGSRARVQTLTPVLMRSGSFVVPGEAWSDSHALSSARQAKPPLDYVVVSHILARSDPWTIKLRLLRVSDGRRLANLDAVTPVGNPAEETMKMASWVFRTLAEHANLQTISFPPFYNVPPDRVFGSYLLRLEQLLAIRTAAMEGLPADFLHGEREIIDGNIQLCVSCPDNPTTRLLLAQTLITMKKVRPDIIPEFANKLALLQKEKPVIHSIQSIVQQVFDGLAAS